MRGIYFSDSGGNRVNFLNNTAGTETIGDQAITSKRIQIGSIDVSSSLRLTEIEDIKSQTGIDIVSKMESVLVNELLKGVRKLVPPKINGANLKPYKDHGLKNTTSPLMVLRISAATGVFENSGNP